MLKSKGAKIVLSTVLAVLVIAVFLLWRNNVGLADQIQNIEQQNQQKITQVTDNNQTNQDNDVNKSGDSMSGKLEIKSDLSAQNIVAQTLNIVDINSSGNIITKELAAIYINSGILDSDKIITSNISCSNCLALGTATTGDYVSGVVAGTDINIVGSGGEGSLPIIYNVSTLQSITSRGGGDLKCSYA